MNNFIIPELQTYYFKDYRGPNCSGPGTSGLILSPDGREVWFNGQPQQVTSQLSFFGPIINKVRELVKKQSKIIIIPFGDEELFYQMPWWSKMKDNIKYNDRTWVRESPIIDNEKYNIFLKYFGDSFIVLTVTLYQGIPSFPNVKLIPFYDEIYEYGPYRNILAREIWPEIPYKDKLDKVVWRGGGFSHHINCKHPRILIEDVVKNYSWANIKRNDMGWSTPGNHTIGTNKDFFNYKVNVMIDGVAGATSEKWVFLTGSVIIMISDWKSFITKDMQPWVHYVPVKTDLSDLKTNVEWIFNNFKEAEKIAYMGKQQFLKLTSRKNQDYIINTALNLV